MGLTQTNALVAIAVGTGASANQAANAVLAMTSGLPVTFALQSITLVQSWVITIQSDDATLNGRQLEWRQGQINKLTLPTPAAPFIVTYTSIVSDATSSIATVTGTINATSSSTSTAPKFVTDLATYSPTSSAARMVVSVDGHAAVGDGGHGDFQWEQGVFASDNGRIMVPAGFAGLGAWVRKLIGVDDGRMNAAWYGVPLDNVSDCYAILQGILDLNATAFLAELYLPSISPNSDAADADGPTQKYCISAPLALTDTNGNAGQGNFCKRINGLSRSSIRIQPTYTTSTSQPNWLGPLIVTGSWSNLLPAYQASTYAGTAVTTLVGGDGTTNLPLTGTLSATPIGNQVIGVGTHFTTELCQGAAINFTHDGALHSVRSVQDDTHLTLSAPYFGGALAGDSMTWVQNVVWLNFSESDTGDINGLGAVTIEFLWNPLNDQTGLINYEMFSSWGNFAGFENHNAFSIFRENVGGGWLVIANLTTSNGSFTVQTAAGHDLNLNQLNHVTLCYDGANLRLFINGTQKYNSGFFAGNTGSADPQMTVACTGTVIQKHYEDVQVGIGRSPQWPSQGGPLFLSGKKFRFALPKISRVARYTAEFTPSVSSIATCDTSTNAVVDFSAANQPTRLSLGEWIIGKSGFGPSIGPRAYMPSGVPLWMRTHTSGGDYRGGSEVCNLSLAGPLSVGIRVHSTLETKMHDLTFNGVMIPMIYEDFSYNNTIGPSIDFATTGQTHLNCWSWNIGLLNGSQMNKVLYQVNSQNAATNWHIVNTFSDLSMETSFLEGCYLGHLALINNTSGVSINGVVFDDETGRNTFGCVTISGAATGLPIVHWHGGWLDTLGTAPGVKVGVASVVDVSGVQFFMSNPIFSFDSRQNNGVPVLFSGSNAGGFSGPVVDPAHPGPVLDPTTVGPRVRVTAGASVTLGPARAQSIEIYAQTAAGAATTCILPVARDLDRVTWKHLGSPVATPSVMKTGTAVTIEDPTNPGDLTKFAATVSIPTVGASGVLQYDATNTRWVSIQ